MPVLLIDAGNSRVKFGLRADRVYPAGQAPRESWQRAFPLDARQDMADWLAGLQPGPTRAVGANVAGAAVRQALELMLAVQGCEVAWQGASDECLGLRNGYKHPTRLGADRWLGLVGVWACAAQHGETHLFAHFGTATTLDAISPDGRFEGGLILPGVDLMRRSLAGGTADLPLAEGAVTAFPDHTHDAIASGVAAAQAGAVVRQWLASRERHGRAPLVHASGGAWPAVGEEVQRLLGSVGSTQSIHVVDNPVLDGLAFVAGAEPDTLHGRH